MKQNVNILLKNMETFVFNTNVKYSNSMDDIYENTEEYNPNKKQ